MNARRILTLAMAVSLSFVFVAAGVHAERADDADRVSKNGSTQGEIDGVSISIDYGRPNVKGREIWGALVPYGKVWRTGANEATTIEFSDDVTINGDQLAAGRYALFTIPGDKEWALIFNEVADQWGAFKYDAGKDALRVTTTPASTDHVESMDFAIDGSTIVLRWAEIGIPMKVAGN